MRIALSLAVVLVGFVASCAGDGQAWVGEGIADMKLDLRGANEGVYPDQSVLENPQNPFRQGAIGQETIWMIQGQGGAVPAFYAWATACARGATGERQFYAALDLMAVYQQNLAVPEDLARVRDLAIAGFQVVLDKFPDSVTYAADGETTYDLATPSVQHILELGGKVKGGWVLVTKQDGGIMAVRP